MSARRGRHLRVVRKGRGRGDLPASAQPFGEFGDEVEERGPVEDGVVHVLEVVLGGRRLRPAERHHGAGDDSAGPESQCPPVLPADDAAHDVLGRGGEGVDGVQPVPAERRGLCGADPVEGIDRHRGYLRTRE
ncbi:hypothetical protein ABZY16_25260 [Streptomyces sp. NPDC006553]|uniref:hypothetical protein n=1 Tax=Streptomyces sp. NPDC006553 TaxID=3157180 RepID=UPI00339EC6BF